MLETSAVVVSCEAGYAVVETQTQAGCGDCHAGASCGTSVLSGLFKRRRNRVMARNPIEARPGERVIIGLRERTLVAASCMAYLIPLLSMILLAIAGGALSENWHWDIGELGSIAGGLFGLIIGLLLLRDYARHNRQDPASQAVILRLENSSRPVHFS